MATFTPAANATTRFSNRVAHYIKYRPGYPSALLESLSGEFGLRPSHVVADVGSGTGISAEIFLRNGNEVIGVEPNREMRDAGDRLLASFARFRSIDGTAESTTVRDASIDWIMAGQAFHWFDVPRARAEFLRILRPSGHVALFWNVRREDTPFLADYERLLQEFALDYAQVKHQNAEGDGRIGDLFGGAVVERRTFPNQQIVDFDGLAGRTLSSSYVPSPDHPRHAAMLAALRELFDTHAAGGTVAFEYQTTLYVGGLNAVSQVENAAHCGRAEC